MTECAESSSLSLHKHVVQVQYTKDSAITVQYWLGVATAATAPLSQTQTASPPAPLAPPSSSARAPASVTPVPSAAVSPLDVHNVSENEEMKSVTTDDDVIGPSGGGRSAESVSAAVSEATNGTLA